MNLTILAVCISAISIAASEYITSPEMALNENDKYKLTSDIETSLNSPTFIETVDGCNITETIEIIIRHQYENGTVVTDDGYIFDTGQYYRYIDPKTGRIVHRGCICEIQLCIRKCCAGGSKYDTELKMCVKNMNFSYSDAAVFRGDSLPDFNVSFYEIGDPYTDLLDYWIIVGNPCKYGKYPLSPEDYPEDTHYLQIDGNVRKFEKDSHRTFNIDEYCMEQFTGEQKVTTLVCFSEPIDEEPHVLYPVGMLISVPFLIATFLVYAIVPELRNLHGKSLMCHVLALAVGYIFLAIIQIHTHLPDGPCVTFAFIVQFSFLVCFFWLNVMCFDIWWTFSGFRGFRGSRRAAEHKKFILYSIYAWGIPVLILIVTIIMHNVPNIPNHMVRPGFGVDSCFFSTEAYVPYLYGPMLVLIVCNILLFTATAIKIFSIQKDTAMLKREDSKRHDNYENDKQRLNLYLKLFVVMGINWSLELISYFTGGPKWLWYVTDIGNTLQGALIFYIFVCKRHIWKLLVKRYHSLMGRPQQGQTSITRTQVTGYSVSQPSTSNPGKETANGTKMKTLDNSVV